MSAADTHALLRSGSFGLIGLRLAELPDADPEGLFGSASLLLQHGLECLDAICELESAEVHRLYWPALYMLRQAAFALDKGELALLAAQAGGAA